MRIIPEPTLSCKACGRSDGDLINGFHEECRLSQASVPSKSAVAENPFPLECYPPRMRRFVETVAKANAFPLGFVGAGALPILAEAIGDKFRLQVDGDWWEPCIVWVGLVGEPGSKKNPVINRLSQPLNRYQAKVLSKFREDYGKWQNDDPKTRGHAPTLRRYRCKDFTIEKLGRLLENNKSIACVYGELLQWANQMNQYRNGQGSDRQQWLDNWTGEILDVSRVGRDGEVIERFLTDFCVQLLGGIQPRMLGRLDRDEDGMSHRFLFATGHPISMRERQGEVEGSQWWEGTFEALITAIGRPLLLEHDAYDALAAFDDMLSLGKGASLSKMSGYTARLAMILSLVWQVEESAFRNVTLADMDRAIVLARWFIGERNAIENLLVVPVQGSNVNRSAVDNAVIWLQGRGWTREQTFLSNNVGGVQNATQRNELLRTMGEMGLVERRKGATGAREVQLIKDGGNVR